MVSSAQKKLLKQMTSIENRLAVVSEYTRLWQEYFKFFSDGIDEKDHITEQQEKQFFQLMNILGVNHFRFSEMAGEYFKDGEMILDVIGRTPSLDAIKHMSDAQFSPLLIDWHTLFISMNKTIGKLKPQLPPPPPQK